MRLPRLVLDRRASALAACALALSAACASQAAAQFAGVPLPPPRRVVPPVASRRAPDSLSALRRERDSALVVQRLDIQAWVDSAAPALARQAPATADSLRRPPAASDSARRPTAPRRPPATPDRPLGSNFDTASPALARAPVRPDASVAVRSFGQYLRPWPCPVPPSRSV